MQITWVWTYHVYNSSRLIAQLFEFKNQEKYLETISAAIIVICGIGMFFLEW
jgi:ABC-type nickel/cobalt efflux system permease component RcnA